MIDEQDRRILRFWQHEPDMSRRALADAVGISQAKLNRRIAKLQDEGVVKRLQAQIDWQAFGYAVRVFLRITLDKTAPNAWGEFLSQAKEIPEIVVIETLVGRVDIRMDVMARDLAHYQEIYVEKILALPHIADIESLLLVSEIKNTAQLPL